MQVVLRIFLLFLALLVTPASAWAYDVYEIDNVYADKAAGTPTDARNAAIADAQAQAFEILLKSLTTPQIVQGLPKLTADGISVMVKSFEVTEEKITGNRYKGRFDIVFNEAQVKQFLATNNVSDLEIKSPPIFVLPIFSTPTGNVTWNVNHPWRQAWNNGVDENSPMRVILPIGDLTDEQILNNMEGPGGLLPFANRYGAREVMMARAEMKDPKTLLVTLQPVGPSPTLAGLKGYTEEFDASNDGFYAQAVASIMQKMQEQWGGGGALLETLSGNRIKVFVGLNNIKDWISMRNKLEGVTPITYLNVDELSLHRAILDIQFSGNFREFQQALDARGLDLLQEKDSYILREAAAQ